MYPEVSLKYIQGRKPELIINDERMDLTLYNSHTKLHELLKEKGFKQVDVLTPDKVRDCSVWAQEGECERNPTFMKLNCINSCTKIDVLRMEL